MAALASIVRTLPFARRGKTLADKWSIFLLIAFETTSFSNISRRRRIKQLLQGRADADGQIAVSFNRDDSDILFYLRTIEDGDLSVASEFIRAGYRYPPAAPDQIIDAGANIGLFSVMASKRFPHVEIESFEANPANMAILQRNLAANNSNARPRNVAVWSGPGELIFQSHMAYSGQVVEADEAGAHAVRVPAELPAVGDNCWLKIDVEGAEYEVLPALLAAGRYPRWISAELHYFDEKGAALVEQLREHGYRVSGVPDDPTEFLAEVFAERV